METGRADEMQLHQPAGDQQVGLWSQEMNIPLGG